MILVIEDVQKFTMSLVEFIIRISYDDIKYKIKYWKCTDSMLSFWYEFEFVFACIRLDYYKTIISNVPKMRR